MNNTNDNINDVLLANILKLLKDKGLTEKDCAVGASLSNSYFSDWKSGKSKNPAFDKIYRIANFLDISIDFLVYSRNSSEKPSVTDDLSLDEYSLLNTYRDMTIQGKKLMLDYMKYLWADHRQPDSKLPLTDSGNCG